MTYIQPRTKVLWHMDHLRDMRRGLRPPPISVEVDLSNRCQLGCQWCHMAYTHTKGPLKGKQDKPSDAVPGGDLMEPSLAIDLISQMSKMGTRAIIWTGGGEPTLHPAFNSVVGYAHNEGLQQGIYTNGDQIDGERAKLMNDSFTWIYISIDASRADLYKRAKGVDKFDSVCESTRSLTKFKGGAVVGAGFLVTRNNFWCVPDMVQLARKLGADYCNFRPTILYDMADPNKTGENTEWINQAISYLEQYDHDPFVIMDLNRFKQYQDWKGHDYNTCWWSGLQAVVTPNGKVWACINKREHPDALLGDLNEQSFMDIWNSNKMHQVNERCRVMCRGHLPNQSVELVMQEPEHAYFI